MVMKILSSHGEGARGKERIATHLARMLGGLIATITAVIVVNFRTDNVGLSVLSWLGPTIVLVPVIFYWARKIQSGTKRKGMG